MEKALKRVLLEFHSAMRVLEEDRELSKMVKEWRRKGKVEGNDYFKPASIVLFLQYLREKAKEMKTEPRLVFKKLFLEDPEWDNNRLQFDNWVFYKLTEFLEKGYITLFERWEIFKTCKVTAKHFVIFARKHHR